MYWPCNLSTTLSNSSTINDNVENDEPCPLIHSSINFNRSLFLTLTQSQLLIWNIRPKVVISKIIRSSDDLNRYGNNVYAHWKPDSNCIIVSTDDDYLLVYDVHSSSTSTYRYANTNQTKSTFLLDAGQSIDLPLTWLKLKHALKVRNGLQSYFLTNNFIYITTTINPSIKMISFNNTISNLEFNLKSFDWIINSDKPITHLNYSFKHQSFIWITADGHAYSTSYSPSEQTWYGHCIYLPELIENQSFATTSSFNNSFSLISIGNTIGDVYNYNLRPRDESPLLSHSFRSSDSSLESVNSLSWTDDGYALAIGWENTWGLLSVYGRKLVPPSNDLMNFVPNSDSHKSNFKDRHIWGVSQIFWGIECLELYLLTNPGSFYGDDQLFCIPFAKSAVATHHSPDNTRYAFLQMDDRVLVYRGPDQSDLSVINPESDVWEHIKVPREYLMHQWPIRYCSISSDGKFIAVAGLRGLAHYSTTSSKWKMFSSAFDEQSFYVQGGMVWFNHILIASIQTGADKSEVRLFSRDQELATRSVLHIEPISSRILLTSLFENALLIYTAENTIHHYLIVPTENSITLQLAGIISFQGIVANPNRVRGMSWMIPPSQRKLGDPFDDLTVATIIFLIDGKLVLLRPRRVGNEELRYDMQVLSDGIEYYWTHLSGIGALENSLWGVDGRGIRLWLDALTLSHAEREKARLSENSTLEIVRESVRIELDFYPLSVLMDKGILIGVDNEVSLRGSLPFVIYRIHTNTHLFLHHTIRFYLARQQLKEALIFANYYSDLIYFPHALEVLLHSVLEEEADNEEEDKIKILPLVITFLDHWSCALQVVVGCARKTEMSRWNYLFDIVGAPRDLFEKCLNNNQLKTASSYLLVLHHLEQLEGTDDAFRLLHKALSESDILLSKEIIRFLHSIDPTGFYMQKTIEVINSFKSDNNIDAISNLDLNQNNSSNNGLSQLNEEDENNDESVQKNKKSNNGLGIIIDDE